MGTTKAATAKARRPNWTADALVADPHDGLHARQLLRQYLLPGGCPRTQLWCSPVHLAAGQIRPWRVSSALIRCIIRWRSPARWVGRGAHQVPHRLLGWRGHPDRRQQPGPVQQRQVRRVLTGPLGIGDGATTSPATRIEASRRCSS
jgi:hypothetical protein